MGLGESIGVQLLLCTFLTKCNSITLQGLNKLPQDPSCKCRLYKGSDWGLDLWTHPPPSPTHYHPTQDTPRMFAQLNWSLGQRRGPISPAQKTSTLYPTCYMLNSHLGPCNSKTEWIKIHQVKMQCLQLTVFKNSPGYYDIYEYLKRLKQSIRCSIFLFSHEFKTGSKGGNKSRVSSIRKIVLFHFLWRNNIFQAQENCVFIWIYHLYYAIKSIFLKKF